MGLSIKLSFRSCTALRKSIGTKLWPRFLRRVNFFVIAERLPCVVIDTTGLPLGLAPTQFIPHKQNISRYKIQNQDTDPP